MNFNTKAHCSLFIVFRFTLTASDRYSNNRKKNTTITTINTTTKTTTTITTANNNNNTTTANNNNATGKSKHVPELLASWGTYKKFRSVTV